MAQKRLRAFLSHFFTAGGRDWKLHFAFITFFCENAFGALRRARQTRNKNNHSAENIQSVSGGYFQSSYVPEGRCASGISYCCLLLVRRCGTLVLLNFYSR